MHDAHSVGRRHAPREVDPDGDDPLGRQGRLKVIEALPREELGDEERPVADLAGVMNCEQVRVLKFRDGARLDTKAGAGLGGRGDVGDLQSDDAIEKRVVGEPYVGCRAATKPSFQAELGNRRRRNPRRNHRS